MAKLGSPVSKKFAIGTAELRIGPMTAAGKLTQAYSVGLVDNVTVTVGQTSVDLMGGFPKVIVDTAITEQSGTVTATMREYSRKNLSIMLGLGSASAATDNHTSNTALVAAAATTVPVTAVTGIAEGDYIVIYPPGQPELVTVAKVTTIATLNLTIAPATHTELPSGSIVYAARQLAIGNVQETAYFGVSVIQQERSTGRPVWFNFWKAAVGGDMTYATNADDFASTEMSIKLLQPASEEYGSTQPLFHRASIIPAHPIGMYFSGA